LAAITMATAAAARTSRGEKRGIRDPTAYDLGQHQLQRDQLIVEVVHDGEAQQDGFRE